MDYQYILFDLDGTLTESGPGIMNSVRYALDKLGIAIPDNVVLQKFVGPPLFDSFLRYFHVTKEQAEQGVTYYREYFIRKGMFENSVYDGIEETLCELRDSGKTLAIATSKPEIFAQRIAEYFQISSYFSVICGASMDTSRITKSDVIAFTLETLEINVRDKSHVLMIGDRKHDISGAKDNGIASLGVLYGYGDRNELENAGADRIISTAREIAKFILGK